MYMAYCGEKAIFMRLAPRVTLNINIDLIDSRDTV